MTRSYISVAATVGLIAGYTLATFRDAADDERAEFARRAEAHDVRVPAHRPPRCGPSAALQAGRNTVRADLSRCTVTKVIATAASTLVEYRMARGDSYLLLRFSTRTGTRLARRSYPGRSAGRATGARTGSRRRRPIPRGS